MKKVLLSLLFLVLIGFTESYGQTSCPIVNTITYNTTPNSNCFTFTLQVENTTGNEKSFQVTYTCGGVTSTPVCVVTPKPDRVNNGLSTYTSPTICCDRSTLDVTVTAYTNAICGGSACAAFVARGGGGITEVPVGTLPVSFKSISATRNKSNVAVTWTTASESNNKGFNVQRNDGSGWKTVSFVFSQSVAGTSNADLSYEYNDANTITGVSQYRIQQVDLDGTATFSIIRAVRGEGVASKLLVYPNPSANGNINVVFDNNTGVRDVMVSDAAGRLVKSFRSITNNILVIENLRKGFYTLKVTNRNTASSSVEKVVVK